MENTRKVAPLLLPSSSFLRTYGIEIELNIVDRITGRPATHEAMTAFWAKLDRLPQSWWDQYQSLGITRATFTREAPVWVVEINSPRCHSFTKMRNWLQTVMSILRELLKEFELVPIGCDLHLQAGPFSRNDMPPSYRGIWDHYNREDGSNPIRLSGMATGTHIHYGTYEDEAETFWLLRQGMPLVPMFVAGTANGPIADQRLTNGLLSTSSSEPGSIDTGLATMRPYLWGHLGTGIGPAFRDEKELWERLIAEYQAGRTDERLKQYFWLARRIEPQWAFKKRPLLGTNEHREMGVQSTIEDTLAWAAFGIVVETWLRCMYRLGKTPFPYMEARPSNRYTASIDDDITRAAHGGLEAIILNPFSADAGDRMTEAANVVRHLVEQVQPVTEALDLQDEMARILWICEGNAGYHWQRLAFQNGGIDAVLRHLINAMND